MRRIIVMASIAALGGSGLSHASDHRWIAPVDSPSKAFRQSVGGSATSTVLSGAEFKSDGRSAMFFYFIGGYQVGFEAAGTLRCLAAPVFLPQGAEIDGFFLTAIDQADTNFRLELSRRDFYDADGFSELMASATTAGTTPDLQIIGDTTVDHAIVDNSNYHYFVSGCLPEAVDHRVYAVEIVWTPAAGGSAVPVGDLPIDVFVSRPVEVTVDIADAVGAPVVTLNDTRAIAGNRRVTWNLRDAAGRPVAAGLYRATVASDRPLGTTLLRVEENRR